jgi:hypothetical protein
VKDSKDVLGFVWFDYYKNSVDWTLDRPPVRAAAAVALTGMPLVNLGSGR